MKVSSTSQLARNLKQKIGSRITKDPCVGDPELAKHRHAQAFVVSHPKSGRTWLRTMLSKYLCEISNRDFDPSEDISSLSQQISDVPYIGLTHDFSSITKHKARVRHTAASLPSDKRVYKGKRVILLVRDLRDVMVSYYFDCTQRNQVFSGDISDFIRDEQFGIAKAVSFLNGWHEQRTTPRSLLVLRYEDMTLSPLGEFIKVCDFLDLPISIEAAKTATEYSSFDNMKKLERTGSFSNNARFATGRSSKEGAYKVRKGKVLGFTEHLSKEDAIYLTDYINKRLTPAYGYTCFGAEMLDDFLSSAKTYLA